MGASNPSVQIASPPSTPPITATQAPNTRVPVPPVWRNAENQAREHQPYLDLEHTAKQQLLTDAGRHADDGDVNHANATEDRLQAIAIQTSDRRDRLEARCAAQQVPVDERERNGRRRPGRDPFPGVAGRQGNIAQTLPCERDNDERPFTRNRDDDERSSHSDRRG